MGAPAIVNGKLFSVRGTRFGNTDLVAIDETSGDVLWSTNIGTGYTVGPPAAVNGKVVVNTDGVIALSVFDQTTGQNLAGKMMNIYSDCRAATVAGGMVYSSFNRREKQPWRVSYVERIPSRRRHRAFSGLPRLRIRVRPDRGHQRRMAALGRRPGQHQILITRSD